MGTIDPWSPRGIKGRGSATMGPSADGERSRISPEVIWSWGVNDTADGIPKMERREVS
ncbi:MAG: hypothetical protein ACOYL4_10275 [Miltoncostaeaceae bacterium]